MKRTQAGFTLVELVVVIVILGLLAAAALPRFINVTVDARRASVQGVAGGLRSAVAVAQAQYQVTGDMAAVIVTMSGVNVDVAAGSGIPAGTAGGIGTALSGYEGYTPDYTDPNAVVFAPDVGGSATCRTVYNASNGTVTTDTTGC